ncbi:peroxidase 57-like [Amaranthus tricolor]|uniref:peroxidase 57-like n=1 Tax=Amaranthus tricolor TaxID=29722 RepID=UPI00258AC4B0|nr:peroxidase 57-like [Amaranthus tricolor]
MKNLVVIVVIVGIISTFSKVSHCYRYRSSLQIGPIIIGGGGHSRSPPLSPPPPHSTPPSPTSSKLKVGFYKGLCPNKSVDIEAIISVKVEEAFDKKPSILPALLRMQFHDCFVHGCDASILIDGLSSEKTAGPNLSVREYELIDALKKVAEAQCPGVVSCADIIAIATKEVIKKGKGLAYPVETGRRDGLIARAQDVNLPSPFGSVSESIAAFDKKNFTIEEMIVLLGCHTVGISHCVFFEDRLYEGKSLFDPEMNSTLKEELKQVCPQNKGSDNFTFLDQNPISSNLVDNSFFEQIVKNRGILPIDQALARDPQTKDFVNQLAQNPNLFPTLLVDAMIKLQALDVLTGDQGQIRNVCSKFN